jgi:hypothetical protein
MNTPSQNSVTADTLAAAASQASKKGPPPVHLWNPPFCGDLDMEIRADGTWFYMGTPIGRMPLVKLFGSILKLEDGKYFLVTPVEKVGIRVEDAPFIAVDYRVEEGNLVFTTNLGDEVTAGPEHKIRVAFNEDEPRPYIHIRRGLEARIDRKSFYRLIEIATTEEHEGAAWLGLRSNGAFFPIIRKDDLP